MLAKTLSASKLLTWAAAMASFLLAVPQARAAIEPERDFAIAEKEFRHSDLHIPNVYLPATDLPQTVAATLISNLEVLGVEPTSAFMDERSGRWGTLLPRTPLLPGAGKDNQLTWQELASKEPESRDELRVEAWRAIRSYLVTHERELQLDVAELSSPARIDLSQRDLVQIHAPRVVEGLTVRNSFLTAVINHGNLILLGTRNWHDVTVSPTPTVSLEAAESTLLDHLSGLSSDGRWREPHLVFVPVSEGGFLQTPAFAKGLGYRLAWVLSPSVVDDLGSWEALVDAHSGELLSFLDQNHYATTRSVVGGVFPNSNDGTPPDGVEQPGWPMPFADVTAANGDAFVTDAGGNVPACIDGTITTELSGPYLRMVDNCGAISESSTESLNLGTSGGTDCTVPPGKSAGNTHSSRSGFYEMNRIIAQAQAQLPDNDWLREVLVSEMNISSSCNAFWNGQVNFFRSGGGCGNTGELAGVFDHEWGHGMDNNGVNLNISLPGEGIPDVYAALRLNDSCIGRGFFLSGNCNGYGDPCVDCSGIRNIDFAKRSSGQPHGIDFAISNCGGGPAPCGGGVHCEGALYAESIWDLFNRDLPSQGVEFNTALELATRLTYVGANPVGSWYNCNAGQGTGDGCNSDGGYLNFLAADDDNGDLNDGTPHMSAISSAFSRHDIACPFLPVVDSGCVGIPTEAPEVTAVALDRGVQITWSPVAGAERYEVFRADGVFGCDFGKERVADTTELSFLDEGLANGREYSYTVVAVGSSVTCLGPMSVCTMVVPQSGPNLVVAADSATVSFATGDGDEFIDNCEEATIGFNITNTGSGSLTNMEIVGVEAISHPDVVITSSLPIAVTDSLSACDTVGGAFDFLGQGLKFTDEVIFRVYVSADELEGLSKTAEFTFINAESDFELVASRTYTVEESAEGWTVLEGTFGAENQPGGGANGSDGFFASSSLVENACDQILSPMLVLSEASTLTVATNFDIQPEQFGNWFDRANFGISEASGERTAISPDSGRLYNADGLFSSCGTENQPGFGDAMTTWENSIWSPEALMASEYVGERVRLSVHYSTNGSNTGEGFKFDEVTLTDVEVQGEDQQPNSCDVSVAPEVTLAGSCPGSITLMVGNGTPGGAVRIYGSGTIGSTVVQSGQCNGLELGLDQAQLLATAIFDAAGEVSAPRPASAAQCGLYMQAVDVTTCQPSERVQVPE